MSLYKYVEEKIDNLNMIFVLKTELHDFDISVNLCGFAIQKIYDDDLKEVEQ
jgi:hypothetical protein